MVYAAGAAASPWNFTETSRDTPGSAIVTPYSMRSGYSPALTLNWHLWAKEIDSRKFDFDAARMFYGDVAPVYTDPSFNAGTVRATGLLNKMDSFGGILDERNPPRG